MSELNEAPSPADEEEVWSWGAGTDGQLGTSKLQDEHLPQLLSLTSLPSISMLACGGAHVIALTSGGKVFTWGRGNSGQLGHGDNLNTSLPKLLSFFDDDYFISQASAGWSHSAFVSDSGSLFTCGNGSFGQLGLGDNISLTSPAKVSYFVDKSVKMVACGMRHSLVLFSENQVCGFGSGKRGQLGVSSERTKSVNLPCAVSGLEDVEVVRIAANGDHSAALSANGELFTWGRGFCGSPDVQTPQCLPSYESFRDVALGWNHALLLTVDGKVFKLGNTLDKQSEKQQLQEGSSETLLEKVHGFDGVKVVQIAAGAEHSAAVTESGEVQTWGWGEHGQLGLGDTNDQTNPQLVSLGSGDLQTKETKVYCGSGFTYVVRRKQ
ncbi:hypothetical protein BRARA_H02170 [Brassica rapa]|uniref:RCC1-like domain-containing protein n=1 Tax=Brassica campestris TaxID=3711 RepID=A0A397YDH8_BRACM|nr:ultraviolet-B receptor UVR8 [Brassica rapa]RID51515.1 hypothetical protein BRARA_H02170 [Brassica rapa]